MAASLIELEGYIFNPCAEKLTVNLGHSFSITTYRILITGKYKDR